MVKKIIIIGIICFSAGSVLGGLLGHRSGLAATGELDTRYAIEYGRTAEIIGGLAAELERERDINRRLREHNNHAREIAGGLAETAERNVRNLQDAVGLIGEIRKKLKVLEDFYSSGDPFYGIDNGDGDGSGSA